MADIEIFTDMIEDAALEQIRRIAATEAFKDSTIRIMPDVHAGKGCVCGFVADLGDKVVPALIGVDIGCGMFTVRLGKIDLDYAKLDAVIHQVVPAGKTIHEVPVTEYAGDDDPRGCIMRLPDEEVRYIDRSVGTLGGGNHFIEVDVAKDGTKYLIIHTGSRKFGKDVCDHWQNVAVQMAVKPISDIVAECNQIKVRCRAEGCPERIPFLIDQAKRQHASKLAEVDRDLAFLTGAERDNYVHDMRIAQRWAMLSRRTIANRILGAMGLQEEESFSTIHNYLSDDGIIRKSAISAKQGEKVLIPLSMKDGSILAIGKGAANWLYSAPHGAGRLMSRAEARRKISLDDYRKSMDGIYTTSVCDATIDEAPFAYKPAAKIVEQIADTVDVVEVLKPAYSFKAAE